MSRSNRNSATTSSADQAGRAEPWPSNPRRPPIVGIYMTNEKLNTWHYAAFAAHYSAAKFLERAEEIQGKFHFEDDDIHFDTGWVLSTRAIVSITIKELMDYKYTRAEDAWELPQECIDQWRILRTASLSSSDIPRPIATAYREVPHGLPAGYTEKSKRTPRPSKDGMTTLADICLELSIDPSDARKELRKAHFNKPLAGWAWLKNDHALPIVKEMIKKCCA